MKAIIRLTLNLLFYTLLLAAVGFLFGEYVNPEWIHGSFWFILAFFVLLTWLTGMFSGYLITISKENSVNILLAALVIRFLSSIGFVAVMLMLKTDNLIVFVSNFFLIYFLYLLFDIYGVITNLRPNSR
jgi:hypothetical protein